MLLPPQNRRDIMNRYRCRITNQSPKTRRKITNRNRCRFTNHRKPGVILRIDRRKILNRNRRKITNRPLRHIALFFQNYMPNMPIRISVKTPRPKIYSPNRPSYYSIYHTKARQLKIFISFLKGTKSFVKQTPPSSLF